jgi:hypothetical protein
VKLYKLERNDLYMKGAYSDQQGAVIVQAASPKQARALAKGAEPDLSTARDWLKTDRTTCRELRVGTEPKVIYQDVAWG